MMSNFSRWPKSRFPLRRLAGYGLWVILLSLQSHLPVEAQESSQPPSRRPLQIEDLTRIKGVGRPKVSPDGLWVAYTITTPSLKPGESSTRIWMVPYEGGEPIPMTAEGRMLQGSVVKT